MAHFTPNSKRVLSTFSLVMINVIAVDNLRTLPISAEYGLSLVFYYLLATVCFVIPTALVTSELATAWPHTGGIYQWVKHAFGHRMGFFVVWLQWIYNVVWYPTILSSVAALVAYTIHPEWVEYKTFVITAMLILFWGATLVNCFGMNATSLLSTLGSILGTLLPMVFITLLGFLWWLQAKPNQIVFSWAEALPHFRQWNELVLLSGVFYGLMGIEMSAVHAQEVRNPEKDYPRALFFSVVIIVVSLILSSLAVAFVVPKEELSIVVGVLQAFRKFFEPFHLLGLLPVLAMLMVLGGISSVAAWIIGPTKGILAAAHDHVIPDLLSYTNKRGVPVAILLIQGAIFTLLTLIYVFLPTIQSSYWILTVLTTQLALIMYMVLFAAAIRLRYTRPFHPRPFRIRGGNWVMWLVAGMGFLCSLLILLIGFFPPAQIRVSGITQYTLILVIGLLCFCIPPYYLARRVKARIH